MFWAGLATGVALTLASIGIWAFCAIAADEDLMGQDLGLDKDRGR